MIGAGGVVVAAEVVEDVVVAVAVIGGRFDITSMPNSAQVEQVTKNTDLN
jgi:hypothetical protein